MYSVSENYKTQINNTLRNLSYIKVNFGIVDITATDDNTISDNGHLFYSTSADTGINKSVQKRYLTFEHNKFILDGKNLLSPEIGEEIPYYQGFVSNSISDSSGVFSTPPQLIIDFGGLYSFIGLTLRFDKILNSYPSELQITAYNGDTVVYNQTHYPDSYDYMINSHVPANNVFCNKLVLTFNKTYPVKRRAILSYIMFGIVATFTNDNITESTWTRSADLLSTTLPKNNFEFTIVDPLNDYNPDNPIGVWQYLEERQPVYFEYGYELDDGTIEWVDGSSLFSNGTVKIDSKNALSTATFSSESILYSLEDYYYKGLYNASGVSLYDLAIEVLTFANLPMLYGGEFPYILDDSLKTIYTTVPLPKYTVKELLQLIANAGRCVIDCNRYGQIVIKRVFENTVDFSLNLSNTMSLPILTKSQYLSEVDTYNNTVTVSANSKEIHNSKVDFSEATECFLEYNASTNQSISVGGTVTIIGTPEFYAYGCLVTLNGTGTVSITGKELVFSKDSVTYFVRETGYKCPIENELLSTSSDAYEYAQWIASILTRRSSYSVEDRGYPEIDIGDDISATTMFTDNMSATIVSSKIMYNGALSGETTYISKDVS